MDTTFHDGEYILTNKLAYKFGQPQYGDVVVFQSPENQDIDFIKRIIAVEGDRIMISDNQVYINGSALREPYIQQPTTLIDGGFMQEGVEIVVPENHVIVMGDNRPRSSDSRAFGPVPLNDVLGRVFFRYFPADRLGTITNSYK